MADLPRQILIVGVGLIGGSFALRLKSSCPDIEIVGAGRRIGPLKTAQSIGAIDRFDTDLSKAADNADVVLLAVPMAAMRPVLEAIRPALKTDAVITDAGSVKGSFIADAAAVFNDLRRVVPGHPIAGAENSGIEAASATLFDQRRVILTPTSDVDPSAVETIRSLWQRCGANVESMDPVEHDRVLAATSHLPHVLAYSLVDTLLGLPEREAIFRYAAGGFRDFTRIASSDPTMWRDVCLSNRDSLLSMIDKFQVNMASLRELIANADGDELHRIFSRTKSARDQHYE